MHAFRPVRSLDAQTPPIISPIISATVDENCCKVLPFDIVNHLLSFSPTYYKENYKNRNGKFYKQIEESRKTPIANVYVPIKRRTIKERFTDHRTYFYERFLGGKYVLYVEDDASDPFSDIEDDEEPDIEWLYQTRFCRAYRHPHIGYGIKDEHRVDSSIVYDV